MDNEKINNSDILFVYDAKMCNPNGDPDDENKPRMDYETETNLVSDVRLKRYVRDYLEDKDNPIFVAKVDGKTVDATQRLEGWLLEKKLDKASKNEIEQELVKTFIDLRLFGATLPRKGKEAKGESFVFTGPIQFNWGYSLNKVSLVESPSLLSTFAGKTKAKEGEEEHGTFAKDYRVYYSLIAFHGIISGKRAGYTKLSCKDIELLQESLIKAIPLQATRSKIGQYPRLFIRVEYDSQESFIGDLRRYIECSPKEGLRDTDGLELKMAALVNQLRDHQEKITKIYYWQDKELKPDFKKLIEKEADLKDKIEGV